MGEAVGLFFLLRNPGFGRITMRGTEKILLFLFSVHVYAILLWAGPRILFLPLGIFTMLEIRCLCTKKEKGGGGGNDIPRDTSCTYRIRTVLYHKHCGSSAVNYFFLPLRFGFPKPPIGISRSCTARRKFLWLPPPGKFVPPSPSPIICHIPKFGKANYFCSRKNKTVAEPISPLQHFEFGSLEKLGNWVDDTRTWEGGGKGNKGIREKRCCVYYTIPFFSRW